MGKQTTSAQKRLRERRKHERKLAKQRRRAELLADKESGPPAESSDVRDYFKDPVDSESEADPEGSDSDPPPPAS